ncbi:class I adenylate-forming enzyme family protein [Pseudooceanicola aestuarii]|uniref:class I adenylate-forming enzyme family protein n=1 Tax=Pseudooceanicola aestuarii TaxID=2697319 RepID=UPI0013D376DC|nr:class I adenylate-forming enzyme family protein [Pseudooceanicola aestuarii]
MTKMEHVGHQAAERSARHQVYRDRGWWTGQTLDAAFDAMVALDPDAPGVIDPPDCAVLMGRSAARWTLREMSNAARNLAAQLAAQGIGRGDVVLVQLPNTAELVTMYLALSRLGAVISPVPMPYRHHEIADILRELDVRAIVACRTFRGQDMAAELRPLVAAPVRVLGFGGAADGGLALDTTAPVTPVVAAGDGAAIFTICWTSGTTGAPKGVPRSHDHWFSQTLAVEEAITLTPGESMLNPFPLTNMAALSSFLFLWVRARTCFVLHHPFDLKAYLGQLVAEKIAFTAAPPAILNMLLQNEALRDQVDLSHVRYIASGSAPLDPWMVRGMREVFEVDVVNFFGSNEGVALVGGPAAVPDPEQRATLFPRPGAEFPGRFGARFETRLVDFTADDREITQPGTVGELLIRGPNVFDGYLNGRDRESFDALGFFRTGDLFEIAGGGDMARFYRFRGRRKELIIRGGMNISPEELDSLINAHPDVQEAATCGYPDRVMGEKVCVFAVPRSGAVLTLAGITEFLERQGVAKFKWPERLEPIDQLPRNPLNKVLRRDLAARLSDMSEPAAPAKRGT